MGLANQETTVMILGTLHGYHKRNPNYSYEHIYKIIDNFRPNVIGVEIRSEDIHEPREYLNQYYPYEMIETVFKYKNNVKLYGFDWFSYQLEGKLIPEGYFDELLISELNKKFENDPIYKKSRDILNVCRVKMNEIINSNPSAAQLNDGRYDIASSIYYQIMEHLLIDSPYEQIPLFYKERDQHIDQNILNIIDQNLGSKIICLIGSDHRVFVIEAIKNKYPSTIIKNNNEDEIQFLIIK